MRRHGHEGQSWGVARVRERTTEGRLSLSGLICWVIEIWVLDIRGNLMLCFFYSVSARGGRQEILSVCLDCGYAFDLWAHGFRNDG